MRARKLPSIAVASRPAASKSCLDSSVAGLTASHSAAANAANAVLEPGNLPWLPRHRKNRQPVPDTVGIEITGSVQIAVNSRKPTAHLVFSLLMLVPLALTSGCKDQDVETAG
ncbi:MAG: hypothetical protein KC431_11205, partial [Myxococcales bacterium]|nr:hypothetical protein [Myxococcales bacterium]